MQVGILILGSTGPTGTLLTRSLCEQGNEVTVIHRSTARQREFESLGASVIIGDAMDRSSIFAATLSAAKSCGLVVNLLGGNPFQPAASWPDYTGNVNAIDAAVAAGIRRCILVTSVGTGASAKWVPKDAYIRPILELKTRAEAHLKSSGLEWTIVKPGGLGPPGHELRTGAPLITESHAVRGLIDRADLANVILRVVADRLGSSLTLRRELYAVVDRIQIMEGEALPFPLPA